MPRRSGNTFKLSRLWVIRWAGAARHMGCLLYSAHQEPSGGCRLASSCSGTCLEVSIPSHRLRLPGHGLRAYKLPGNGLPDGAAGAQRGLQTHSMPAVVAVFVLDGPHRMLCILLAIRSRVQAQHGRRALKHVLLLCAQQSLRSARTGQRFPEVASKRPAACACYCMLLINLQIAVHASDHCWTAAD